MSDPELAPLEFGMSVFPFTRFKDASELRDTVVEAEALGFGAASLPEHLLPPAWPLADVSTKYWFDTVTLGAFLAGATTTIRFLTSVLVVPYHPPIQTAKALASLDVLSNGRVLLGVGAGWMQAEFRRLQIDYGRRAAITDEYLRAMVELWTSDSPRFSGEYVEFEDVSFLPRPVQQPIPLLVGGSGRGPFRRAAEIGHGWLPMTATPDLIRSGLAEIHSLRKALGRAQEPFWVGCGVSFGADPETARMRAHVDQSPVSEVAGPRDPQVVVAEIAAYRAAGVNFLSIGCSWTNGTELRSELRRFAAEVLPAFR